LTLMMDDKPAVQKTSDSELELLAECLICPHTRQGLRVVGGEGLATSYGHSLFYPKQNRRVFLAPSAAPQPVRSGASANISATARWILEAMRGGEESWNGRRVLELMPSSFSLGDELEKIGAQTIGVMLSHERPPCSSVPSAAVASFDPLPVRADAFDEVVMLDPRLWRTGIGALLREAARALKPGGRVWMLVPLKGGPLADWIGQLRSWTTLRGTIRQPVSGALGNTEAAEGAASWLVPALRRLRRWDGILGRDEFERTAATAGLKLVREVLPEIGLVCLQKAPVRDGESAGIPNNGELHTPLGQRPPDCNDASIQRDAEHALYIVKTYCDALPGGAPALREKTVLELGPRSNLGTSLCLAALGAKVYAADRFPVRWCDDYHPKLYGSLRAELLRRHPSADPSPIDLCLEFKGHPSAAVWQLPCPSESLTLLGDASIDITVSCAVLEHLSDPRLAARELARVTRDGGYAIHQVDFRDHRDLSRPLEYLLPSKDGFRKMLETCHAECGNRTRPVEIATFMDEAGFQIEIMQATCHATPEYLADFIPRLRAATDSEYREWPEAKLRELGAMILARRLPRSAAEAPELPVLKWDRALSDRFWQRVSGTNYLISKAFSRIVGDDVLDLLRGVFRKEWKYVDFGSGANGFIVEKMLNRGLSCASYEPSRTDTSRPYPFANHPLYLGEAATGRDGEFDCVLITEVIEHVQDEDFPGFMRRVRALLKPRGIAIFTTPNREDLKSNSVFCPVAEVLFHQWQHLRSWQPELLEAFLEGYGFAVTAVHQVDFSSMYPELEKRRLLAGMLRWLVENRGSAPVERVDALIGTMHALASDPIPLRAPALPLRGRDIQGYGSHLLAITQPR
jgi:SAM-dependent methyltransferase